MRTVTLALAGLLCNASAHAEVITYEFTGQIYKLVETELVHLATQNVATSAIAPGGLSVGDTFHGRFSYNTDQGVLMTHGANAVTYAASGTVPAADIVFNKNGMRLENEFSTPRLYVQNKGSGQGGDLFKLYPTHDFSTNSNLDFTFGDSSGNVFSNLAIPLNLTLAAFTEARANIYWTDWNANVDLQAFGNLTSLARVSAVPEPSTGALLLGGLAVFGAAARKRSKRA